MGEPFSAGDPLPPALRESWADRPQTLARERVAARYARFHAPLAVLSSVVAFLPPFTRDVSIDGTTLAVPTHAGPPDIEGRTDTAVAGLLAVLLLVLALLLALAAFRGRKPVAPLLASGVGLAVWLLAGFGPERTGLSPAGITALVVAAWAVPLGVVHAVNLARTAPTSPGTR